MGHHPQVKLLRQRGMILAFDVESAEPQFSLERRAQFAGRLGVRAPDHTAAGDVLTLRACYVELAARYAEHGPSIRAGEPA